MRRLRRTHVPAARSSASPPRHERTSEPMTYVRNNPASFVSARAAAAYAPWYRDLRVLNALLIAGIAAFFVGYLVLNNQAASKGFAARTLEKRIADLEEQRQKLDLDVVAVQSMDSL